MKGCSNFRMVFRLAVLAAVCGLVLQVALQAQTTSSQPADVKLLAGESVPAEVGVAALEEPEMPTQDAAAASRVTSSRQSVSSDDELLPAMAKELQALREETEAMRQRIEQLETQLRNRLTREQPATAAEAISDKVGDPAAVLAAASRPVVGSLSAPGVAQDSSGPHGANALPAVSEAQQQSLAASAKPQAAVPFAFADFTWLNGTPRNKDTVWDSKYFTPEFRVDSSFMLDYNHPVDHTMGGSAESLRSGEWQVEQLSFGGDLHVGPVRGRILTMNGMFSTSTPRSDASAGVGNWDLRTAYRYLAEAYGGYHFDVNHGLNIDAGIFVSYIGLFSYYNFDNWAYQPSFVSSNTPWYFEGLRIQWFPTDKLKIEPWIINGWQSYARYNKFPGLGGQILWMPKGWLKAVFNNYGMGTDTLGVPGRSRIHTDNSVEVKYYDRPSQDRGLDKMAFSLTGDLGCEYGGGVSCYHNGPGGPKQSFAGWMLYNRFWLNRDRYGITLGGGMMDNPGRYLTLLPPINGADVITGSPYFPAKPGSVFKGWDSTVTFDYMPQEYITFRFETGYRHSNVPYWTGPGGLTPPGGNNGFPTEYVCKDGAPSLTAAGCGGDGGLWLPDLRRHQTVSTIAILVKF